MKNYTITRACAPVNWDSIPALAIDTKLWGTETDITAQGQLCYDDSAMHIRLSAVESDIRAVENGPLGSPCQDSCLEFFFCPVEGDNRYFNIEFSPTGCYYLGFGSDRYDLVRLIPEQPVFTPDIRRMETGWEIAYSIPFSFIRRFFPGFSPEPGKALRANLYKCGDLTVNEHYLSWNPIEQAQPDYHLSRFFAPLYFG